MKKLFLGLIATVMFCFAGNAQNSYLTKSFMTVIVSTAQQTYTKGLSYKDWLISQTGSPTAATAEEEKFLKEVYGFISTNTNAETVFKKYDGLSLLALSKLNHKSGIKILDNGEPANRFCFICWLKRAVDALCLYFDCNADIQEGGAGSSNP